MPILEEYSFKNYLKDKNVILVGPSETISLEQLGNFIDSFDVVVRLNRAVSHLEGNENIFGSRTDILYACLSTGYSSALHPRTNKLEVDPLLWKQKKVGIVSSVYPSFEQFYASSIQHNVNFVINSGLVTFRHMPDENYKKVKTKINCHLNSGMVALCDLLDTELKSLYICGLDFHRTKYFNQYDTFSWDQLVDLHKNHSQHDPDKQFKYFKYEIFNKDKRVKVDKSLDYFLSDIKFENTINK